MATRKKTSEFPPELQALIPEPWYYDNYISREVSPGVSEFDALEAAHSIGYNVLIDGPTGSGKTSGTYAYAAMHKLPIYSVPCNGAADPSTLFGSYVPDEARGSGYVWRDGPVTLFARHGGVLLLNEVNFLPPKVAATLYGLFDKRRTISLIDHGEVIVASAKLLLVADYNPDYEGTRPLNQAFKNRFGVKMHFGYSEETEDALVHSKTLREIAEQIRVQHREGNIETPPATNMLLEFETLAQTVSFNFAIDNFCAAFTSEEIMSVRKVFDLNLSGLEADYNVTYE